MLSHHVSRYVPLPLECGESVPFCGSSCSLQLAANPSPTFTLPLFGVYPSCRGPANPWCPETKALSPRLGCDQQIAKVHRCACDYVASLGCPRQEP